MFRADRDQETICALSTPTGAGALAIVRLSGKNALSISRKVAPNFPEKPESHRAHLSRLVSADDQIPFDEALITYFARGKSFTGEEVVEFSTHGSSAIVQELLKALVFHGAKPAERGEFTYRAFMGGQLDLVQAEGVLALIESQSKLSSKQALRQLKGGLSEELLHFESEIIWGLAHIEAGIDFSTEGLETVSPTELRGRLQPVLEGLEKWIKSYEQGRLLREGLTAVLTGRPNVGKSSLLNALVQEEKAIVTEIAGTTRDLIESSMMVGGIRVNWVDTAGLRESQDVVEKMGIARTHQASKEADVLFFVFEAPRGLGDEEVTQLRNLPLGPLFLIANKVDQGPDTEFIRRTTLEKLQKEGLPAPLQMLFVSALDKTRAREKILSALELWIKDQQLEDSSLLIQARHYEKLSQSLQRLREGLRLVGEGVSPELAAFDLKEALLGIQETLGKYFDDQVLDRVFKEFCIGK